MKCEAYWTLLEKIKQEDPEIENMTVKEASVVISARCGLEKSDEQIRVDLETLKFREQNPSLLGLSQQALLPLIREKDKEIKEEAILLIEKLVSLKAPQGGRIHKKISRKQVIDALAKAKGEPEPTAKVAETEVKAREDLKERTQPSFTAKEEPTKDDIKDILGLSSEDEDEDEFKAIPESTKTEPSKINISTLLNGESKEKWINNHGDDLDATTKNLGIIVIDYVIQIEKTAASCTDKQRENRSSAISNLIEILGNLYDRLAAESKDVESLNEEI